MNFHRKNFITFYDDGLRKLPKQTQASFKHVPPLKQGLEQKANGCSQFVPVKSAKQIQTGLRTPF